MKDPALLRLLRRAAQTTGLIILTDSDAAGFLIRNTLKSALPQTGVLHAYIPDLLVNAMDYIFRRKMNFSGNRY